MSWTRLWMKLDEFGKRAWIIIVLIGLTTIGLSSWNLSLLLGARKPHLITTNSRLLPAGEQAKTLTLYWDNVGGSAARNGTAALFTIDEEKTHREKLDEKPIRGAGIHLMPGSSASVTFVFDTKKFFGLFLVCAVYIPSAASTTFNHDCVVF